MASSDDAEETKPLTYDDDVELEGSTSRESVSSISTTSLVLERLGRREKGGSNGRDPDGKHKMLRKFVDDEDFMRDEDTALDTFHRPRPVDKKARRLLWIVSMLCVVGLAFRRNTVRRERELQICRREAARSASNCVERKWQDHHTRASASRGLESATAHNQLDWRAIERGWTAAGKRKSLERNIWLWSMFALETQGLKTPARGY